MAYTSLVPSNMRCFIIALMVTAALAAPPQSNIITLKDLYAQGGGFENRIISGQAANVGQFPWQAAVHFNTAAGSAFCGGALISPEWVLTAGHCSQGARSFTIRLGGVTLDQTEEGREDIYTTTKIVHHLYNPYNLNNDIALVKLPSPVKLTDRIKPIRLPARGSVVGAGDKLTVSGWGKTSDASNTVSKSLNFVELTTISNKECANVYGLATIVKSTVCCRGRPEHSTCNGDSGGPLVSLVNGEPTHVGVVSFVHIEGCASGNPSGYVRTESFLDWIHQNTGIPV